MRKTRESLGVFILRQFLLWRASLVCSHLITAGLSEDFEQTLLNLNQYLTDRTGLEGDDAVVENQLLAQQILRSPKWPSFFESRETEIPHLLQYLRSQSAAPVMMRPTLETTLFLREKGLEELCEVKKLTTSRHQTFPNLVLLKYSQVESSFDDPVVNECRGLIVVTKKN